MLAGLLTLLLCDLAGEIAARALGLPLPGPVVGLVLFFMVLRLRRPRETSGLVRAPQVLLSHLQLLFVPAGVGVIAYVGLLRDQALPVALGLWGSWLLGLLATGWSVSVLLPRRGGDGQ